MDKVYQVFVQDEYNNNYMCGFYNSLDDCIDDVNQYILLDKYKLSKGDIKEYPTTFDLCFDVCLYDILLDKFGDDFEDCNLESSMYIRGFIFDKDSLIDELTKL